MWAGWTATLAAGLLGPALALPPSATAAAPTEQGDGDRTVRIDVSRLEPRTITTGSTVTVSGTLTNTGAAAIRDLAVRLQRGEVMTTRAELVAAEDDPDPTDLVTAPFAEVPGTLGPGETVPFTYSVPAARLQLREDGVYPVLVNVNAVPEGDVLQRVGELPTYLVRRPAVPSEQTAVAWLWPLAEESSRAPGGGFADDELAASVRAGGRLDAALGVLERLPRTAGGEQPALPVALAVDPALVEELGVMASGPYRVGPDEVPGEGTEAAAEFLGRLRALAAVHPVIALPYGDVDADALHSVGLGDVVTRSLPGTPAGTAQGAGGDPPPAEGSAVPADPSTLPGPEGSPPPSPGPAPSAPADEPDPAAEDAGAGAGARILAEALGAAPRTDLAWAAGGSYRANTVATLRAGGVRTVVVGQAGVSGGERAVGLSAGAASAAGRARTRDGDLDVLVADTRLGTVVDAAEDWAGGPRLAEQRYLAELALIGQQAPDGATPTVLVAPPREVQAGPDGAGAMMADTAGLPWLRPLGVPDLASAQPPRLGRLTDPADAVLLDAVGLADVAVAERIRDDLAGAVATDADAELRTYDAATARAASSAHRDDPEEFRSVAVALRSAMAALRDRVSLVVPADGTYSLASDDAPLVLTLQNDLPFPVTVQVDLSTSGESSLVLGDIGPQTLTSGQRVTLEVPAELRGTGSFQVGAALTTPGGTPLGERVQLQVKSTGYGTVSLLITSGAAGLLALLFLRRLVRFLLRRRRAGAAAAAGGASEGAAVPVPPTRSPV